MIICGIDPGVGGAVAWLNNACGLHDAIDMPTVEIRRKRHVCPSGLRAVLISPRPDVVVVEHVQGVQGAGATSSFAFGRSMGVIEGVLAGLEIPCVLVPPQRWTRELGVSRDKGSHRAAAARLWPAQALRFARAKDDGRADAALLAWWYARHRGEA